MSNTKRFFFSIFISFFCFFSSQARENLEKIDNEYYSARQNIYDIMSSEIFHMPRYKNFKDYILNKEKIIKKYSIYFEEAEKKWKEIREPFQIKVYEEEAEEEHQEYLNKFKLYLDKFLERNFGNSGNSFSIEDAKGKLKISTYGNQNYNVNIYNELLKNLNIPIVKNN